MIRRPITASRALLRWARIGSIVKSRVFIATTAVATTAVISFGIAQASIPDSNGVFHGCYKTADVGGGIHGGLKVLDTAVSPSCPFGQNISWQTKGQLLYRKTISFSGPYTNGETVATFTSVPAGKMCTSAAASAYTTSTELPIFLGVTFVTSPVGLNRQLGLEANENLSHKALMDWPVYEDCAAVPAGTYSFAGYRSNSDATSDALDHGSITVDVFAN